MRRRCRPASCRVALARRRRRGALAALSVLLLGLFLVIFLPTMNGAGTASKETAPREQPAGDRREPPDERPAAAAGDGDGKPGSDNNAGGGTDDAGDDAGDEAGNVAAATDATTEQAPDGPGGTPKGDAVTSASGGGVPDVSGRSLEEAAVTLREAGYDVTAIQVRPGSEEPGTVIETEPGPGTDAPSGSPVVLTTSSGPTGTASASASSESVSSASASAATSSSASASASPSP